MIRNSPPPPETADRPVVGVMMGDRHGIGPEITVAALADPQIGQFGKAVLFGDSSVSEFGRKVARLASNTAYDFVEVKGPAGEPIGAARVTVEAGREVLETWNRMLDAARRGEIHGIVYAPINKEAVHQAGMLESDDLDYMSRALKIQTYYSWLYVLDGLWMSRITGHVALSKVSDFITQETVLNSIRLLHETIEREGVASPRIAVAGLNPHAGDGGLFGDEEIRSIGPAISSAKERGIDVDGPVSPDTVFVRAKSGEYDGVVTMYHDQGGIAMKLLGFGRGVAVMGGLPFPIVTVGHGTAYDIAGRGIAKSDGMLEAFRVCSRIAATQRRR